MTSIMKNKPYQSNYMSGCWKTTTPMPTLSQSGRNRATKKYVISALVTLICHITTVRTVYLTSLFYSFVAFAASKLRKRTSMPPVSVEYRKRSSRRTKWSNVSVADAEAVQVAIRILRTKEKVIHTCVLYDYRGASQCSNGLTLHLEIGYGGRFVLFKKLAFGDNWEFPWFRFPSP